MSNVLEEAVEGLEPLPALASVLPGAKTPVLLSLDIGTSGVRAALFDERGGEITGAKVRIDRRPLWNSGPAELALLDADSLVEQVAQTIDALFVQLNGAVVRVE